MSGYTDGALVGQLAVGAAFLQKPLTPGALTRKVREVLDAPDRNRSSESGHRDCRCRVRLASDQSTAWGEIPPPAPTSLAVALCRTAPAPHTSILNPSSTSQAAWPPRIPQFSRGSSRSRIFTWSRGMPRGFEIGDDGGVEVSLGLHGSAGEGVDADVRVEVGLFLRRRAGEAVRLVDQQTNVSVTGQYPESRAQSRVHGLHERELLFLAVRSSDLDEDAGHGFAYGAQVPLQTRASSSSQRSNCSTPSPPRNRCW